MNKEKNEFVAHYRVSDGRSQSLETHLSEVSEIAGQTSDKMALGKLGALVGLAHDLGKYSAAFQTYLASAVGKLNSDEDDWIDAAKYKGKIDHSTAGAQYVWQALCAMPTQSREEEKIKPFLAQLLAIVIASHHSGLINCLAVDLNRIGENLFMHRIEKEEAKAHFQEVRDKMNPVLRKQLDSLLHAPALFSELESLDKKLTQTEKTHQGNCAIKDFKRGLLARFLLSSLVEGDHRNSAEFETPERAKKDSSQKTNWAALCERLEAHLSTFSADTPINKIRAEIANHCFSAASRATGMYTLTVPTGGGKTLASLRFALHHAKKHGLERIIYVIPFTTIIDQNAALAREILEPEGVEAGSVLLEHHSNLTPEKITWQYKLHSEHWDVPIIYTTSVQCLEALFGSGTRNARRMHALTRAVLIFDEIQALPLKCAHLFANALNFLVEQAGSSVVLCTATQPLLHEIDPTKGAIRLSSPNAELMPNAPKLFENLARTRILYKERAGGFSNQAAAEFVCETQKKYPSVLMIVNTKKVAREIFKMCHQIQGNSEGSPRFPAYHLSTSMCPAHRMKILTEIREKLAGKEALICVSTQLIEAGVDVSFSSVIRSLSGADSIAQAAGRCNRHQEQIELAPVFVIKLAEENLDKLEEIRVAQQAAERLFGEMQSAPEIVGSDLLSPKTMAQYFRYAFYERKNEMSYPVSIDDRPENLCRMLSSNEKASEQYKNKTAKSLHLPLKQAFHTAAEHFKLIDAPTQSLVVPYGKEGKEICALLFGEIHPKQKGDLLRRAQAFSVNIYTHELKKLQEQDAVHYSDLEILCLKETFYHPQFGLSMGPCGEMPFYDA